MIIPYNHCDLAKKQNPLPIKLRELPSNMPCSGNIKKFRVTIPTASANQIVLELHTDSSHLGGFFSKNWLSDDFAQEPDAKIVALKESARFYGLPAEFDESRWFCPKSKQVWMFGTEYYGNLKISVRGLCSEVAPFEEMFLHGCSMSVNDHGLVLAGMSGAGKTTITSALRQLCGSKVKIINDDWGSCSLTTGILRFTGEPHLHMKYSSVRSIAPELSINPSTHLSENFSGNFEDPKARLLISPTEVFGKQGLQSENALRLFVVIIRNLSEPVSFRWLTSEDISLIESGQYSSFYNRVEWFLNGSLFLLDEARRNWIRNQYEMVLSKFPSIVLNNSGNPQVCAELVLTALENSTKLNL